jgi:hypothetical protein
LTIAVAIAEFLQTTFDFQAIAMMPCSFSDRADCASNWIKSITMGGSKRLFCFEVWDDFEVFFIVKNK